MYERPYFRALLQRVSNTMRSLRLRYEAESGALELHEANTEKE